MIKRKAPWVFLSLVVTVLLMALTLGVAAASSHVITGEYIGVTSYSSGSGSSAGIVLLAGGVTLIVAIVAASAWATRRR